MISATFHELVRADMPHVQTPRCDEIKHCRSFKYLIPCMHASLGGLSTEEGAGDEGRKLRAGGFEPAVLGPVNLALFTQDKIPTATNHAVSRR